MKPNMLVPPDVWPLLAPLGSTEDTPDPPVTVKYFTPWTGWTWYATEASAEDTDGNTVPFDDPRAADVRFFGLVDGLECELGYWLLSELLSVRGPVGLMIERDHHWRATPLSVVRQRVEALR